MSAGCSAVLLLVLLINLSCKCLLADVGVLIPSSEATQPDPAKLSLADLQISILIEDQNARARIRQVFESHVGNILEGKYLFGLRPEALISDFAVWDGAVRIPGVILERKRAEEIYDALRLQMIDPGLLQQQESGEEGGSRASFFSAKIAPIPAYGTKRLELEYTEQLAMEQLQSHLFLPLKPRQFQTQSTDHLRIDFVMKQSFPLTEFKQLGTMFRLQIDRQSTTEVVAHYEGSNVALNDDLSVSYRIQSPSAVKVLFYRPGDTRSRDTGLPSDVFTNSSATENADKAGFFQATALFNAGPTAVSGKTSTTFLILFDTSLSVRWDKLERQFEALEKLLYRLSAGDYFQLFLFNSSVAAFGPAPVVASPENISAAIEFVRASNLSGGTNLREVLERALRESQVRSGVSTKLVLLSDGNPTLGSLRSKQLTDWFGRANDSAGQAPKVKFYAYGIGNDCNRTLLRGLASLTGGLFEYVSETEATEFKLNEFINRLRGTPLSDLEFTVSAGDNFFNVYRFADAAVFNQTTAHWVGTYRSPKPAVTFSVSAVLGRQRLQVKQSVDVPDVAGNQIFIPRNWAKARVDFLLNKIELEGEDAASIREIIELSRKYKFVTPYTSFLAAPRSLLRPRLIKPGDPVLRVRTDPQIRSILAIFPFGLNKPLRYLSGEDVWQTRFLAPKEMVDGTYSCRLILRDKSGTSYVEQKTFVIDSHAPEPQASSDRETYHAGETVRVKVRSDADTRYIRLHLGNMAPVEARWDQKAQANVAFIPLPAQVAPGRVVIEITAEDFAHNVSVSHMGISVVP